MATPIHTATPIHKQFVEQEATAPHFGNTDAEQLILCSIFASEDPEAFRFVAELLQPEMFSLEKHRRTFEAMLQVWTAGRAINPTSVHAQLATMGFPPLVAEFLGGAELVNIETYCQIVLEEHRRRVLYGDMQDMMQRLSLREPSEDVMEQMRRSLLGVEESLHDGDEWNPEDIVKNCGGPNAFLAPEYLPAIMSPWRSFNDATGGLRGGELSVIGAKPGVGKTTIALNIAWHAAKNGHRVRLDQWEMLPERLLRRLVCSVAHVDQGSVRRNDLDARQRDKLNRALGEVMDSKNYLTIPRKSPKTIQACAAAVRRSQGGKHPVKLWIGDYIQKIRSIGKHERRDLEVYSVVQGGKSIAIENEIPAVMLSQLSVDAKEQYTKHPTEDDFRESKGVGQEADIAFILRLSGPEQRYAVHKEVNGYMVKHRDGATGKLRFLFRADIARYESDDGPVEDYTDPQSHENEELPGL